MSVQLQHRRREQAARASRWCIFVSSLSVGVSLFRFKQPFLFASLQVEDETLESAVYVNVAQLRKSISKTPPSCSPSHLDLNGWEVHVDQESGQEYYYHPTTGQTTWDKPFLDSPTYPESLTAENPLSPSSPLSPVFSPSTASPSSVRTSDWEQLVDETSGRPYFYNLMSGETTWEPPEQLSPYPPMMEPMSVHRFHEDGPVRTSGCSTSAASCFSSTQGKGCKYSLVLMKPTEPTRLISTKWSHSTRAEYPQQQSVQAGTYPSIRFVFNKNQRM